MRPRSHYCQRTQITTRRHDNDVYQHVTDTIYYVWLDTAVNAWLREAGLLDIAQGDAIGLVVETGCTYAMPIGFPAAVEIGPCVARIGRSSVKCHLGVFVAGAEAASAQGHFTHVYVDRAERRPIERFARWRSLLETLS